MLITLNYHVFISIIINYIKKVKIIIIKIINNKTINTEPISIP